MKHCFITPIHYLNTPVWQASDMLLVLSHLLDERCTNEYAQQIVQWKKEVGGDVVLDNGLYENHIPEAGSTLLMKAYYIGASSVFAPDYLYDCQKTRESLFEFVALRDQLEKDLSETHNRPVVLPKVNYVVQANNVQEYMDEFGAAQDYPIAMIGLSILAIPKAFSQITGVDSISLNRAVALPLLDAEFHVKKPCHMLWLWESLVDIRIAKNYEWIVSNDSCLAFWTGYKWADICYDDNGVLISGKPKAKLDFELIDPAWYERGEDDMLKNVGIIKAITH